MLSSLRVRNLALVQDIQIEFEPGLNVVTGETGAGKSILIGALKLLLGERADKALIRAGETSCSVEAIFDLAHPEVIDQILHGFDLEPTPEGQLILRRSIKMVGASQNLVNDSPVTLQAFRMLGRHLVDMHGPYDHQSLLHQEAQLQILDAFGEVTKEKAAYDKKYDRFKELDERKNELLASGDTLESQLDLLSYRVQEMEEAELKEGEEEEILEEHKVTGNAQQILELTSAVIEAASEGESSALDQLGAARRSLSELVRVLPEAEAWAKEVEGMSRQLQELTASISGLAGGIEAEPARLDWLDQRLATYDKMKRKYGGSVAEVLANLERSRLKLEDLSSREERLAELEKELKKAEREVHKAGAALTAKRKKASGKLAKGITEELKVLGFEHGSFGVDLQPHEPAAAGMDEIDFQFAPNAGEPPRPLRAIASSGEISRVMLASKAVLARHDQIPLLVFDEIDANVGGEMGSAMGRKLADVAKWHQVICITHLPQVAIYGQTHYAVKKEVRGDRTYTRVDLLDGPARIEEVARMLGGRDSTRVTLDHARELLESV